MSFLINVVAGAIFCAISASKVEAFPPPAPSALPLNQLPQMTPTNLPEAARSSEEKTNGTIPLTPGAATTDGRHDFDFLQGLWTIQNRRLTRRLAGCTEWQEFEATQEVRPVLGGLGNVDRFNAVFPGGKAIEGMTIRIYDPKTRLWSLYWVDDQSCQLQPPVLGRFTAGAGEFFGDDVFDGKPIKVVFRWKVVSSSVAHWEQAFSADGGKTWETNWEMTMTRVDS